MSVAARDELTALYDPRADSCEFALALDEQEGWQWKVLPVSVVSDLLVDPGEPDVDWDADYFEYRLVNPERWRVPLYEVLILHIGGVMLASRSSRTEVARAGRFSTRNVPSPCRATSRGHLCHRDAMVAPV